ncbi:MAG: ABC transporter ATP-binding protein [Actinomycetes bacterium]
MVTELLRATGLTVAHGGRVLVDGIEVTVRAGETTAIVGESGSGKSLTARAIVGLLPDGLRSSGAVGLGGTTYDLATTGPQLGARWRTLRRRHVALLLQDPFASLSPVHTVGRQVGWALGSRDPALIAARLAEVGLEARVAGQYPHELSGGMRQRVSIVLTLAQDPEVLIADEPTTALDSLTQADILELIDRLKQGRDLGVVLISHDLDLVARHSQQVLVMRLGEVVESGRTAAVLADPRHEYTRALLAAVPRPGAGRGQAAEPVVAVRDAVHHHGDQQTLRDVSLEVRRGEIVGLIGQSGSGKTTLARCIAGLETLAAGAIEWSAAPRLGMVFQDPAGTLNPALSIRTTLREALAPHPTSPHTPESLMELVGLDAGLLRRRPARLSGGQRQRVAVARALAGQPSLLICDEAVSALDVSVQAQILTLLTRLRDEEGVSILFITHDLGVVAQISERIYVLNEGVVVETGDTAEVVARPGDAYTRRLLAASSLASE